jgi:hypothetical protein
MLLSGLSRIAFLRKLPCAEVTVGWGKKPGNCKVCKYRGPISGVAGDVSALISWLEAHYGDNSKAGVFLCADLSEDLKVSDILAICGDSCAIERCCQQIKIRSFDTYKIRSVRSFEKLIWICSLFHLICPERYGGYMQSADGQESADWP